MDSDILWVAVFLAVLMWAMVSGGGYEY